MALSTTLTITGINDPVTYLRLRAVAEDAASALPSGTDVRFAFKVKTPAQGWGDVSSTLVTVDADGSGVATADLNLPSNSGPFEARVFATRLDTSVSSSTVTATYTPSSGSGAGTVTYAVLREELLTRRQTTLAEQEAITGALAMIQSFLERAYRLVYEAHPWPFAMSNATVTPSAGLIAWADITRASYVEVWASDPRGKKTLPRQHTVRTTDPSGVWVDDDVTSAWVRYRPDVSVVDGAHVALVEMTVLEALALWMQRERQHEQAAILKEQAYQERATQYVRWLTT